ncbi:Methionyl-tRNA formyltransferase, mitochondrial [Rhodotorula toruloides]|nr:Methionyl-tRNA formyltransferase, mitochondrial [Rhodotorula toruloides]
MLCSTRRGAALLSRELRAECYAGHARRCFSSTLPVARKPDPGAPKPPYNVLFFGADFFSCAVLKELWEAGSDLIGKTVVVVPPEQKTGRKGAQTYVPPLKTLAQQLDFQVEEVPPAELKEWVIPRPWRTTTGSQIPDSENVIVTASYGHMLPLEVLNKVQQLNALNVHPSILPRWRGAAPIQYAIMKGDADGANSGEGEQLGVTVQELSRGAFDKGRILAQKAVPSPVSQPGYFTLESHLAREGGLLLVDVLRNFHARQIAASPQDPEKATLAPKITKEVANIKWNLQSAREIERLNRAIGHQEPLRGHYVSPSTAAMITVQMRLSRNIYPLPDQLKDALPGVVFYDKAQKLVLVRCADAEEAVAIDQIKKDSGIWVFGKDWYNGIKKLDGQQLLFDTDEWGYRPSVGWRKKDWKKDVKKPEAPPPPHPVPPHLRDRPLPPHLQNSPAA